ncbi:5961_t:CDS:2 [Gigaspora margarita]|uniref:5961_t:CDS:1 n=1 Tax=Gigaspora margarita TaxID=4874 RepID=A0ABM8VYE3_GIGMA|nr:5961_t:CDS:2 [Gigaspora margarita]
MLVYSSSSLTVVAAWTIVVSKVAVWAIMVSKSEVVSVVVLEVGAATLVVVSKEVLESNTPRGLRKLPSPPGRRFYFGHFFQLGPEPHKKFTEWARSLGDIYGVYMGQQYWVILTGDKVVGELLQKRGAKYSSRSPNYYSFELLYRNKGFNSSPYNERYRMLTPLVHGILGQRNIKENSDIIDNEYRILIQNLCKDSENTKDGFYPKTYFHHAAFNIIALFCWGKRTENCESSIYKEFGGLIDAQLYLVATTNRVSSFFPILKWLPKNKLYNMVIKSRTEAETFFEKIIKDVKEDKEKRPCAIRDMLNKINEGILDDEYDIIHDSVASSLTWLTAVLANHPEIQAKAHQELDQVIGQTRLPKISDEPNLHYIRAIIKEGQRYCGPVYLSVPHYIEEDDDYNGYHIPANSAVVINSYGIHMDEKRYENPKEYNPERFLGIKESSAMLANGNCEYRDHFGFGAGRRLCTGIHLAERELFMGISHLLWCFRIENASPLGKDGRPIPIGLDIERFSITVWPKNYRVRFVKRHDN